MTDHNFFDFLKTETPERPSRPTPQNGKRERDTSRNAAEHDAAEHDDAEHAAEQAEPNGHAAPSEAPSAPPEEAAAPERAREGEANAAAPDGSKLRRRLSRFFGGKNDPAALEADAPAPRDEHDPAERDAERDAERPPAGTADELDALFGSAAASSDDDEALTGDLDALRHALDAHEADAPDEPVTADEPPADEPPAAPAPESAAPEPAEPEASAEDVVLEASAEDVKADAAPEARPESAPPEPAASEAAADPYAADAPVTEEELDSLFGETPGAEGNGSEEDGSEEAPEAVAEDAPARGDASEDDASDAAASDDAPPAAETKREAAEKPRVSERQTSAPRQEVPPAQAAPASPTANAAASAAENAEGASGPRMSWLVDFMDEEGAAPKEASALHTDTAAPESLPIGEEIEAVRDGILGGDGHLEAPPKPTQRQPAPPQDAPATDASAHDVPSAEKAPPSEDATKNAPPETAPPKGAAPEDAASENAALGSDALEGNAPRSVTLKNEAPERGAPQSETSDEEEDAERDVPAPDPETALSTETALEKSEDASPEETEKEATETSDEELLKITARDRVVGFLLKGGIVTLEEVRVAQKHKEEAGSREALWRVLAGEKGVNRGAVFAGAARVYAFPMADLEEHPPNVDFTRQVMETFTEDKRDELLTLGVVPLRAVRDRKRDTIKLYFITHDPGRPDVHRLLRGLSIENFSLQYAPEKAIAGLVAEAFPKKNEYLERMEAGGSAMDLGASYEEEDALIDDEALEAEISRSKLINLFEATLIEAVRKGASDIHIYPNAQKQVEVHFRIDGRLHRWHTEDKVHPEAFLAVVKDNSTNVDRFERDKAQDGFIQRWVDSALIRFRVSVMPIANASQEIRSESIVIRVLDDRKVITDLSKLGLLEGALEKFQHAISQPNGMVILTGPTGSGKSTTLVASLHQVISPEVNVLTVEDPVEYIIPDVRQIKLNHKLQLEDALRSILRHDPDVVMVGEMRDRHTAELAIKLANTGHLTFSTLHTNDAPSAISRLYKMGIEPFLIAYAINLVVAQRLIRKLCPDCKAVDPDPDPVLLKRLGFTEDEIRDMPFYTRSQDKSCKTCNGFGYKGRRAVSEALYFSREIRHMIVQADRMIDEAAIREQAQGEGMLTLQDSAREIVKLGETSIREMIRVVTSEA